MNLYQLIYTSTAKTEPTGAELIEMLRGSRRRNAERGVTGVILYHEGQFMQVLEGEEAEVEALFKKISYDPRHLVPTVVWRGAIEHREFPDSSMAFRDLRSTPLMPTEGFSHVLLERLTEASVTSTRAAHFIRAFRHVTGVDR